MHVDKISWYFLIILKIGLLVTRVFALDLRVAILCFCLEGYLPRPLLLLHICWSISIETICIKPVKSCPHESKVNIAFVLSVKVNISLYKDKIRKFTSLWVHLLIMYSSFRSKEYIYGHFCNWSICNINIGNRLNFPFERSLNWPLELQ